MTNLIDTVTISDILDQEDTKKFNKTTDLEINSVQG
jgi:hypothetical protein